MWDPGFRTGPPGGGLEGNQGDGEGGRGVTLLFVTSPGLALSDTGKGVTGQVVCSYPFVPSSTYRDMGPTGTGGTQSVRRTSRAHDTWGFSKIGKACT